MPHASGRALAIPAVAYRKSGPGIRVWSPERRASNRSGGCRESVRREEALNGVPESTHDDEHPLRAQRLPGRSDRARRATPTHKANSRAARCARVVPH